MRTRLTAPRTREPDLRRRTHHVLRLQSGTMAHRQRDGGDDGDQQQHGGQLERIEILRVEHFAQRARIAVALGCRHDGCGSRIRAEVLDPHDAADLDDDQEGDDQHPSGA